MKNIKNKIINSVDTSHGYKLTKSEVIKMRSTIFFTALVFMSVLLFFGTINAQQRHWKEQNSGTSVNLLSISAPDDNVAWVAGPNGTVIRTKNNGKHWKDVSISFAGDLWSIYAFNKKTALVAGNDSNWVINHSSSIYRTVNGGKTWQKVLQSPPEGHFNAFTFFDDKHGILYGDPVLSDVVGMFWEIYKTDDGGATWTLTEQRPPQLGNCYGWNNAMTHVGNTVYFGTTLFDNNFNFGPDARIYKSTDRGETWTFTTTPGVVQVNSIDFKNCLTGFAGGAKTTDGGATWFQMNDPYGGTINQYIQSLTVTDSKLWVTGIIRSGNNRNSPFVNPPQVFYSTNGGNTWTLDYTASSGTPNEVKISENEHGDKTIYVIRNDGKLAVNELNNHCGSFAVPIENIDGFMDNYPNPFNPTTNITYQIPTNGYVSLKIYDMLGREIATLVNEVKTEGFHTVQWNASGFSSGTYFYRIQSANFTDIKRMTLIK